MYCPSCNVRRPQSHMHCFDCGALLKSDHQDEHLWATLELANQAGADSFFDRIKQYADAYPENVFAQKLLGNALLHKGHLIAAEARYRAALDLAPNNIELLYDLCIVLYYQARLTEARRELQRLLQAAPNYSAAHYRLGLTYYHLGQYEDAVRHLKTCASLTPEYEMAHFHLGVVYAKMGKVDESIREFSHQLDMNLKDAASRTYLEDLFEKKWQKKAEGKP